MVTTIQAREVQSTLFRVGGSMDQREPQSIDLIK